MLTGGLTDAYVMQGCAFVEDTPVLTTAGRIWVGRHKFILGF